MTGVPGTGTSAGGVFRSGTLPSTTATTVSSTTSTTVATTTRPASACALGCDDGDPCTTDFCAAGVCRHDPAIGFDAVTCALRRTALPFDACGGVIPSALAGRIDRARSLIDTTRQTTPRRVRRSLARAFRILRAARRLALAAGRRGEISADCTDALARLLADAAARTRALYR